MEAHHLYDSNAGRQLFKHQPGYDPNILGLALLAWTLSLLGLPEQAAQRSQESLRRAHRSARALDIVSSLEVRAKLPLPTLSDSDFSASYETMQTLAEQHGFPYWIAEALIIKGELALRRGHAIEAVSILRQGVDAQRAGGATFWSSHHAIQLSSALGQAQRPDEAIAILDRAIEAAEDTEDRWYLAELLRRRALLYLTGKSADQARGETELNKALEIAREQTAKLWELRAATSLARLWQVRGQTAKARKLLGPVYAWFTEGLDTADLLAAKALLDELGN